MKKIRTQVFETNSSSVHTLVIDPQGLGTNKLTMDSEGYVLADFGQFGTEEHVYKTQDEKMSYLLTELYYINHWDENIEENYNFDRIVDALNSFDRSIVGIKVLKKVDPEIDHQSQPDYGESRFVNYWDKESIKNFIFNDYMWIKTDCD